MLGTIERIEAPESKRTTRLQTKNYEFRGEDEDGRYRLVIHLQHDDNLGNGRNHFSITHTLYDPIEWETAGVIHLSRAGDEWASFERAYRVMVKECPQLLPLLRYHGWFTDGPTHYVANTTFLAGAVDWDGSEKEPDLEGARATAAWPDGTAEELTNKRVLEGRLPLMLHEFKAAIEAVGFTY